MKLYLKRTNPQSCKIPSRLNNRKQGETEKLDFTEMYVNLLLGV